MGAIAIPFDPILFHFGPLAIRWYGIMIAMGIAVGGYVALREAGLKGISADEAMNLATVAVPVGLVFSRLFHVVDNLDYYAANPIQILFIQQGGLAIWGAILGGALAGVVYCRVRRLPVGKVADAAAPGIILGQAIGRIGCFINGDHQGFPTNLPWGTMYTDPNTLVPDFGVPRHPTQVYEMLYDLALFGFLWWLRKRTSINGTLFLAYLAIYSFGRFWISFLRLDVDVLFGLKEAQLVSVVAFLISVPWIVYLVSRGQRLRRQQATAGG